MTSEYYVKGVISSNKVSDQKGPWQQTIIDNKKVIFLFLYSYILHEVLIQYIVTITTNAIVRIHSFFRFFHANIFSQDFAQIFSKD